MTRSFHKVFGISTGALAIVIALSGAWLSLYPDLEQTFVPSPPTQVSVAQTLSQITHQLPNVQKIDVRPSGLVHVQGFGDQGLISKIYDPATGQIGDAFQTTQTQQFLTELHRSLMLGETARILVGGIAGLCALLCISGGVLLMRRLGGMSGLFGPMTGSGASRWHSQLGRLSLVPLLLSSVTGLWLALAYLSVIPDGSADGAAYPLDVPQGQALNPSDIAFFADMPLSELRQIVLPFGGDAFGIYSFETAHTQGYLSAVTGEVLSVASKSMSG